jgi:hypothetical protein
VIYGERLHIEEITIDKIFFLFDKMVTGVDQTCIDQIASFHALELTVLSTKNQETLAIFFLI